MRPKGKWGGRVSWEGGGRVNEEGKWGGRRARG